jgi:hypothetical protein
MRNKIGIQKRKFKSNRRIKMRNHIKKNHQSIVNGTERWNYLLESLDWDMAVQLELFQR